MTRIGFGRQRPTAVLLTIAVVAAVAAVPRRSAAQVPEGRWNLRICYSAQLKRGDPSLGPKELLAYPMTFSGSGRPELNASVAFPDDMKLVGRLEGTAWRITNWYVGDDRSTTRRSRGTALVTFDGTTATGAWTTVKGSSGTWRLSTGTPPSCAAPKAEPKAQQAVRIRVQTAPTQRSGIVVRLGSRTVTTGGEDTYTDVMSGRLTISASGPDVRSILIRSTGGDALAGNGTGAHCTGSAAEVVLEPAARGTAKQDYIVIVGLTGSTTPRGPCQGTRIEPVGASTSHSGPNNLKRFDAEVTFAGDPFLSPNCGVIASQHIQVSIHGGVGGGGPDPFYGGGNISEFAPREIVPGSPKAPPDCESNGFVFWAIDGDFSVEPRSFGAVRTLRLQVWVDGGGDRTRPQECTTPTGTARRIGTITLIDSDEFLRPQGIEADAIEFGPFGAGCASHDRAFSNVAFTSGIGWVSKANVELSCETATGLSPKNC